MRFLCALVVAGSSPAFGQAASPRAPVPDTLSAQEALALRTVAAVVRLRSLPASLGIWPGYDASARPLLLYVPDRWALLLNAPTVPEGFTPYPADWPPLGAPAALHRGTRRRSVRPAGIRLRGVRRPGGGGPVPAEHAGLAGAGVHVHRPRGVPPVPARRAASATDMADEEYPMLDAGNTALASVEARLLMDAVSAAGRHDRDEATRACGGVRRRPPRTVGRDGSVLPAYERPQELIEGTAKYVEVRERRRDERVVRPRSRTGRGRRLLRGVRRGHVHQLPPAGLRRAPARGCSRAGGHAAQPDLPGRGRAGDAARLPGSRMEASRGAAERRVRVREAPRGTARRAPGAARGAGRLHAGALRLHPYRGRRRDAGRAIPPGLRGGARRVRGPAGRRRQRRRAGDRPVALAVLERQTLYDGGGTPWSSGATSSTRSGRCGARRCHSGSAKAACWNRTTGATARDGAVRRPRARRHRAGRSAVCRSVATATTASSAQPSRARRSTSSASARACSPSADARCGWW